MLRSTLETIIKTMEVSSKDETRPALCGVCVERVDNERVLIQATDGHVMMKTVVLDSMLVTPIDVVIKDSQFIISNSSANISMMKAVLKVRNQTKFPELLHNLSMIPREYYKTDVFSIPKPTTERVITLDLAVLNKHIKSLGRLTSLSPRESRMVFRVPEDTLKPVYLQTVKDYNEKNSDNFRVIMPVRI